MTKAQPRAPITPAKSGTGKAARKPATAKEGARQSKTPNPPAQGTPGTKAAMLIGLLSRPEGASIEQLSEASGWMPHSVRGFMAGTLRKNHGLATSSEKIDGTRIYRIAPAGDAA